MAQAPLQTADATNWAQWVTNFDRTYGLFQQTLNELRSKQQWVLSRGQQFSNRYMSQLNRGNDFAERMARLKSARDRVANWLGSIGHNIPQAVTGTMDWLRNQFGLGGQLALAPLVYLGIGLATAAAALAACAYWINETQQLNAVITEAQRLEARGVPAAEAARIAQSYRNQRPSPPIQLPFNANGIFGIPWLYVAGGVAALAALPMILRRR